MLLQQSGKHLIVTKNSIIMNLCIHATPIHHKPDPTDAIAHIMMYIVHIFTHLPSTCCAAGAMLYRLSSLGGVHSQIIIYGYLLV